MIFVAVCHDKPGALPTRLERRPAHLDYLNTHSATVKAAGAMLGPDGNPIGSMLILDCADQAAAEAFCAGDPFAEAGLFERVEVRPWRQAVGDKIG
jgi:hypothetical protein